MVKINVVSMVVTTDLKHNLILEKIALQLLHVEYNPKQFPGLVMKIKEPKTSVLLFSSGKVVCTGAKNLDDTKKSINKIIENLKKVNTNIIITVRDIDKLAKPESKLEFDGVNLSKENYFGPNSLSR